MVNQIKAKGEKDIFNQGIYSDQIARINSFGKRKLKNIMITDNNIHIFTPKNNKFELKMSIPLRVINAIKWAKNNSSLMLIEINPRYVTQKNRKILFDQLIESFRRKNLTLFLKQQIKKKSTTQELKVVQTTAIQYVNRYGDRKIYNTQEKNILKTELQQTFEKAEMIGYVSLQKPAMIGGPKLVKFMVVLTNLGMLVLDIGTLDFKGFIPLLGVKVQDSKKVEF